MLLNWLFGISIALAEEENKNNAAGIQDILSLVLTFALMGLVFYFLLIRPQQKKDKQVKEMLNNLKRGDRVTTIGGIYGTIESIKDDTITLVIGQKNGQTTEMTIARWAIRQVEEKGVENDSELQG